MTREDASRTAVAGYVLAGGASSRFGRDKALARLGEETLLQGMLRLIGEVADSVHVVATADRYAMFRERIIADRWPGEGPLGGITTALFASQANVPLCEWNLILSCDMPFLTREWLKYMVARARDSEASVVVPQSDYGLEPLCACWRTSCVEELQTAFDGGVRKVTDAMKRLRVEVLDETHWKRFDTAGRLFWNMNTQQDYEEAVRIWRTENE